VTSSEPERYIPIRIDLSAQHPDLFARLEGLLHLGLLSDRELRELCRQHLTCPLPEPVAVPIVHAEILEPLPAVAAPSLAEPVPVDNVANLEADSPASPTLQRQSRDWVGQFLERLINEVSVIWLLCLGVFLVVVSSGVLAASQWQQVPPVGQYGILFGYTIAFVLVGLWIGRQPRLQLTASMLQIASLLIIPVNFWMMDGFRLLQTPTGTAVAAIAAVLLSVATFRLLPRPKTGILAISNVLALNWLHWGWGVPFIPLLATYAGCIYTSWVVLKLQARPDRANDSDLTVDPENTDQAAPSWLAQLVPANILLPFALLLILFRAVIMAQILPEQLSLAFGICGWLLCWLARKHVNGKVWGTLGAFLLVIGWQVGQGAAVPWQAVLVCGLGLWLLGDVLQRHRQPISLAGLVILGLITIALLIRLIPESLRGSFIEACVDRVGPSGMPQALVGIGLYPYLWGVLALGARVRRWQVPQLVRTANISAWLLGISLVLVCLPNPSLRSLSLGLAFATMVVVLRQRPAAGRGLISITHGLGIVTLCSSLANLAPNLATHHWGVAALIGMGLEWAALGFLTRRMLWQENSWYAGLGAAGLGYLLFLVTLYFSPWEWRTSALAIPTALTLLLFQPSFRWRSQALGFSIGSMIAVQILTFDAVLPRLIGLGLGAGLMFVNTIQRPNPLSAVLSVGFALTFSYATGWETLPHTFQGWIALSTGLLLAMVTLRHVFPETLAISRFLKPALDGWSIAVMLWSTLPLGGYALLAALQQSWSPDLSWQYPVASVGILGALVYRFWQKPNQGWLIGIAWAAEISLICVLAFWQQPLHSIGVATLALGLFSILLAEVWVRRTGQPYRWSWQLIPLGYGGLGWCLTHTDWTASTGVYTLALAAIGLGVGRRQLQWMPITILGLVGISIGAFELLVYQLLQAQGGEPADGVVALAALAIALAIVGVVIDRWGSKLLNLPAKGLHIYGHCHWALATFLIVMALILPFSPTGERLWAAEALVLGGYALVQGRQQPVWVYPGLMQLSAAMGQSLYTNLPAAQLLPWASAITSGIGLAIYSLPWQRWGWVQTPFKRFALLAPALMTMMTAFVVNISSLLVTGGFYGWVALASQTTRLSYVGLVAANWAGFRLLEQLNLSSRIWSVSLVGLSLLFIAQVDPSLRTTSQKGLRHWLRCFAVGLICTVVLYESDPHFLAGLLAIGLSLALGVIGILLRIRAFLYVGTVTFIAKILRLVWVYIADQSLVLWALGIALGLLLIWIAATFEARRAQVTALLQYWVGELEQWQ
jgi:hypothetical protein